jgi:hypothetical protein
MNAGMMKQGNDEMLECIMERIVSVSFYLLFFPHMRFKHHPSYEID